MPTAKEGTNGTIGLVEMLAPYKGRVYDPCCGSGGKRHDRCHIVKQVTTGLAPR